MNYFGVASVIKSVKELTILLLTSILWCTCRRTNWAGVHRGHSNGDRQQHFSHDTRVTSQALAVSTHHSWCFRNANPYSWRQMLVHTLLKTVVIMPTGSSGEVVFQNVPAGEHRVRVIAGNGDAVIRSFIVLMPDSPHFCSLNAINRGITKHHYNGTVSSYTIE